MNSVNDDKHPNKKAIAANEERFRALVNATSDIVYIMSADWREMKQLEGRNFLADTNEPLTDWISKYIHPLDQDQMRTAIDDARKENKIFSAGAPCTQGGWKHWMDLIARRAHF